MPLPTTAVTNELLTAASGMGIGEQDFAIALRRARVDVRREDGGARVSATATSHRIGAELALEMYRR